MKKYRRKKRIKQEGKRNHDMKKVRQNWNKQWSKNRKSERILTDEKRRMSKRKKLSGPKKCSRMCSTERKNRVERG